MIKSKLISLLVIIIGFAGGYYYYSLTPREIAIIPLNQADDLSKFSSLSLNFSIFTSDKYTSLQLFGESPVQPGVTTKKDPFAP